MVIGRKALQTGFKIANNVAEGQSFKDAAKSRLFDELEEGINNFFPQTEGQSGPGNQRKRSRHRPPPRRKQMKKKRRKLDTFFMMSHVDTYSCTCVKSELNIFSVPPTQTSIDDGIVVDYHPIASFVDTGPIEFDISASVEHYLDLALVYLHLDVKITKNDESNLEVASAVGPTNICLHSLFF